MELSLSPEAASLVQSWKSTAQEMAYSGEADTEDAWRSLACAIISMIGLGGRVVRESDTMIVGRNEYGFEYGVHFDGRTWSVHS